MASHNGNDRLDRIEHALELLIDDHVLFRDEHKKLLTAQVLLTDRIGQVAKTVGDLAEAGKQTDERLNGLIGVVDGFIRRQG